MKSLNDGGLPIKPNGHGSAKFPRVDLLRKLLGDDVLLLAWPFSTKGTAKKWKHFTAAKMEESAYLASLEAGNIGVAQGALSAGVCSIDLDDDEWMNKFLAANPSLQPSLRTRGVRGCNVWVRCVGNYPATFKLKAADGQEVGEWRASGAQTIISGIHPSGCHYSFLIKAPPVSIAFDSIVWPKGIRQPSQRGKELPIEHSNAVNSVNTAHSETQVVLCCASVFSVSPFIVSIQGQSDRLLFAMARHLKTWEKSHGRASTSNERQALFKEWWNSSKAHVDPKMNYYNFLDKWTAACKNAKYPDDETPLTAAWKAANNQPLPPEALVSEGVEPMSISMQLLVALCFHLQQAQGSKPFFLGSRDAGRLLDIPHTTVFNWLNILADKDGPICLLKKVSIGSQATRHTNEWLYLPLVKEADHRAKIPKHLGATSKMGSMGVCGPAGS